MDDIGHILATSRDTSAHTNLLALDAAIEAADTGDQGCGLAVIVDGMGKLVARMDECVVDIQQNSTPNIESIRASATRWAAQWLWCGR